MTNNRRCKALLIVDMSPVINDYINRKGLYSFFAKFPLKDIIQTILSIGPYVDYSQMMYDELDMRFEDEDIGLDIDLFVIFYEGMMEDVDQTICSQYSDDYEEISKCSYIFDKWIDNTSLMIRIE